MPSKPFIANYDGRCTECGGEIVADVDDIVMDDGEAIHTDCAQPADGELSFTFDA